jgi:hypothetical protein
LIAAQPLNDPRECPAARAMCEQAANIDLLLVEWVQPERILTQDRRNISCGFVIGRDTAILFDRTWSCVIGGKRQLP